MSVDQPGRAGRDPMPGLALGHDDGAHLFAWVVAAMVYLAALGAIALILLGGMLRAADGPLAATLTLEVPAGASAARMETVMATLRQTKGVVSANVLDRKEIARLLEPWLGPNAPLDEMPVPQLVDVRIDPASPPDLAALRRELASVVPGARLDDRRSSLGEARAAARRVAAFLVPAIAVALLLIALAARFAVRAALERRRSEVELVHLLGADDAAIVRPFATRSLALALLGGAAGAAAALLTIAALGDVGRLVPPPVPPEAASGLAGWRVWAAPAAAVVAAGLIATASARLTARRWLAAMP